MGHLVISSFSHNQTPKLTSYFIAEKLKSRFLLLDGSLRTRLTMSQKIIRSAGALHNLAIHLADPEHEEDLRASVNRSHSLVSIGHGQLTSEYLAKGLRGLNVVQQEFHLCRMVQQDFIPSACRANQGCQMAWI